MLLFLPSDTFLFRLGFFSTLSRRQRWQQEESDGEGHLNKPSVEPGSQDSQAQPDLWLSTPLFPHRGPSPELLDVLDPVYYFLSPLSTSPSSPFPVPLSHFSFFLCPSISPLPLFLYLGISFSLSPPPFSPRHPGQLFIQTGCLQLSVRSWVAAPEVGRIACGVELFPNTSVSSLRSIHDLSVTRTPQLHVFSKTTHTLHRGRLEEVTLQKMYWINTSTKYCVIQKHKIHYKEHSAHKNPIKIKHSFEGVAFTVQ